MPGAGSLARNGFHLLQKCPDARLAGGWGLLTRGQTCWRLGFVMSLGQMPDLLEAGVCDVPYYKVPRGGQTCWRLGLADVRHKTYFWGLKLKGCAGDTFELQAPRYIDSSGVASLLSFLSHAVLTAECTTQPDKQWRKTLPTYVYIYYIYHGLGIPAARRFSMSGWGAPARPPHPLIF